MTRVETDGGDKDSTDNPGEIHSTRQPQVPCEHTEPVSFNSFGLLFCRRSFYKVPAKQFVPA